MAVTRAPSLLPAVRFESSESNNGAPLPRNLSPPVPHLSISKPSWIVRTESNVRKVRKKKPDPPCVVCSGSGRVDCYSCNGKVCTNLYMAYSFWRLFHCDQNGEHIAMEDVVTYLGPKETIGRMNSIHLAMLPKGEWPKWCRTCGGSGLGYCSPCLGTGEYRYIMGFHFMKRDSNDTQGHQNYKVRDDSGPQTAADLLLNGDQRSSNPTPGQQ